MLNYYPVTSVCLRINCAEYKEHNMIKFISKSIFSKSNGGESGKQNEGK